jgi:hypothetical protein
MRIVLVSTSGIVLGATNADLREGEIIIYGGKHFAHWGYSTTSGSLYYRQIKVFHLKVVEPEKAMRDTGQVSLITRLIGKDPKRLPPDNHLDVQIVSSSHEIKRDNLK